MSSWKRPECVTCPTVWAKFEGPSEINGVKPKFWIQDITEDMDDMIATVMSRDFLRESPLAKYSKYVPTEESTHVMHKMWLNVLKRRLGLACFMENLGRSRKPILAGVNCTYLVYKGYTVPEEFRVENCKTIFNALGFITKVKNVFELLEVDEYMGAMGLFVLPEFRRQGLATELLKARVPLCKAVGLKATCTVFTAKPSQIVAEKVGFKDIVSVLYKEIEKCASISFPGLDNDDEVLSFKYLPL